MLLVNDLRVTVNVVPLPPCWTQLLVNETEYLQSSSLFDVPTAGSGNGSTPPSPAAPLSSGPVLHMPTAWNMPMQASVAGPGSGPPPDGHAPLSVPPPPPLPPPPSVGAAVVSSEEQPSTDTQTPARANANAHRPKKLVSLLRAWSSMGRSIKMVDSRGRP